ncbi:hypothetical protein ACIBI0_12895 [Microbispora rosea]|uniref:hypothetical protein n=1 Tax=Microbispora rosea TaxID=58117 RepID=UPI00378CE4B6
MLQDVLADTERVGLLKPADRRGLTPLFWRHVQPCGEVRLHVAKSLPFAGCTELPGIEAARAGRVKAVIKPS